MKINLSKDEIKKIKLALDNHIGEFIDEFEIESKLSEDDKDFLTLRERFNLLDSAD